MPFEGASAVLGFMFTPEFLVPSSTVLIQSKNYHVSLNKLYCEELDSVSNMQWQLIIINLISVSDILLNNTSMMWCG